MDANKLRLDMIIKDPAGENPGSCTVNIVALYFVESRDQRRPEKKKSEKTNV